MVLIAGDEHGPGPDQASPGGEDSKLLLAPVYFLPWFPEINIKTGFMMMIIHSISSARFICNIYIDSKAPGSSNGLHINYIFAGMMAT